MQVSHFAKYDALVEESSRDPKLAMRDCERKLKKSPQDPAFNLFKTYLLIKQRLYEPAHQSCLALADLPRAVEDSDLVTELLRLERKLLQALAREADVSLTKSLEKHKDCLQAVFGSAIAYGFWEAAESVAIGLQKLAPKDKQRQHVRFLMGQLYATSCRKSNPTVSAMRERLLKAMLKKAIDGVSLSTAQDLRFFSQVYVGMADWNAALELLDNSSLGWSSPLGNHDIEFIRSKLECLIKLQRWHDIQGLWGYIIHAGIDSPLVGEESTTAKLRQWWLDAALWRASVQAVLAVEHESTSNDFSKDEVVLETLQHLGDKSSASRVAWVARLEYAAAHATDRSSEGSDLLIAVCGEYLSKHHSKRYCYEDLQPYATKLSTEESTTFLQQASELVQSPVEGSQQWATTKLNCLKLRFLLTLSKAQMPAEESMQTYVVDVLAFAVTLKSKRVADEACLEESLLLAAAGLQKAIESDKEQTQQPALLLRTIAILEHALLPDNAPTSYRARLLLIACYRRIGCISLAMQHYQALRCREIQNDTVSHLLYHRISLLHPFATDSVEQKRHTLEMSSANPTLGLQKIIDWYDVAIDRTNGFVSGPIDSLRYDKVQEFLALKTQLEKSLWRQLATLERRRIARLTDRAYDETDNKIDFLNSVWVTEVSDMRDFSRGTSFRMEGDSDWRPQDLAETQEALHHAAAMTELDATQSLLFAKEPVVEHRNSLIRLTQADEVLKGQIPASVAFSEGEEKVRVVIRNLRPLVLSATLGDKPEMTKTLKIPSEQEINDALAEALNYITSLQPLQSDELKSWLLPDQSTLSLLISQLDCLKTIVKLTDWLAASSKQKTHVLFKTVKAETVTKVKSGAMTKGDVMQNAVQEWRAYIKSKWRTVLDPLKNDEDEKGDGEVAAGVEKLVGKAWVLNSLAPMLRDSMIDTLDGVVKIRVG